MSDFYTSISSTAKALVDKFGKNITLKHETGGVFDPVTGTESGVTVQQQTVKAVVLPASGGKVIALDIRYNLGTLVYRRLGYFLISGQDLTFEPLPDDQAVIEGETWTVLGVTPLNPNSGDPIIHEVAIRI